MVVNTQSFHWPETDVEHVDLTGLPVLYVMVTQPKDQAVFQRYLALKGYVPYLLCDFSCTDAGCNEMWRFHHPDGPKPL